MAANNLATTTAVLGSVRAAATTTTTTTTTSNDGTGPPNSASALVEREAFDVVEVDDDDEEERSTREPSPVPTATPGVAGKKRVQSEDCVVPALEVEDDHGRLDREEEELRRQHRKKQQRRWLIGISIFVLVVVGLIGIVVGTHDEDTTIKGGTMAQSSAMPTPFPTFSEKAFLKSLIPQHTIQTIETAVYSPQHDAFDWILQDYATNNNYSDWQDWRIKQRFGLVTFFYATDGNNWKDNSGWLNHTSHECQWFSKPLLLHTIDREYGNIVSTEKLSNYSDNPCEEEDLNNIQNGRYYHLCQQGNEVHGTLPPEVFELLPSLLSVNLDPQGADWFCDEDSKTCGYRTLRNITGNLPSEVGVCTGMAILSVEDHGLSGLLPSTLAFMTSLRKLRLSGNLLSGLLPSEIGSLTQLESLALGKNNLHGTIPSEIGMVLPLSYLDLSLNGFNGTIPSEIGLLTALEELDVSSNNLSGSIPTELGSLALTGSLSSLSFFKGTYCLELFQMPFVQ